MAGPELMVLVRHAKPVVDPAVPPADWELGPEGTSAAARVAERLQSSGVRIDRVVSSIEPKAVGTGRVVADHLGLPFQTGHDLHEHVRREFVADRDELERLIGQFFARPDEHVYGDAPAGVTERRFSSAVDAIAHAHKDERLCVVAHGLVLCLHLAARYDLDAHATHLRLGTPAYIVVDRRSRTVVDLVDSV